MLVLLLVAPLFGQLLMERFDDGRDDGLILVGDRAVEILVGRVVGGERLAQLLSTVDGEQMLAALFARPEPLVAFRAAEALRHFA